jgi:PhnB protein
LFDARLALSDVPIAGGVADLARIPCRNALGAGWRQTGRVTKDEPSKEADLTTEGSTAISAMLIVPDAESAIAWYQRALGARELWNLGGVAGLEIGNAPFFVHEVNPNNPSETDPEEAGRTSTRIELFVEDPDEVLARALEAGATLRSPVEAHAVPWGTHRQGGFRDPFGHSWSVGDRSPLRHVAT